MTSDPIGLGGGINVFGYVEGNPIAQFDYMGLGSGRIPNPNKKPISNLDDGLEGLGISLCDFNTTVEQNPARLLDEKKKNTSECETVYYEVGFTIVRGLFTCQKDIRVRFKKSPFNHSVYPLDSEGRRTWGRKRGSFQGEKSDPCCKK